MCRVGYGTRVSVDLGICGWPWSQSPEDTCGQLYNQNPSQTTSTQREDQEWQVPGRLTVIVTGIWGAQASKMGEQCMNLWKRAWEHLRWIFMKYLIRRRKADLGVVAVDDRGKAEVLLCLGESWLSEKKRR